MAPRKRYKTPLARRRARGGFAAVFACLKGHFPAAKIFYDLRLDLRFVCYNGCELGEMDTKGFSRVEHVEYVE